MIMSQELSTDELLQQLENRSKYYFVISDKTLSWYGWDLSTCARMVAQVKETIRRIEEMHSLVHQEQKKVGIDDPEDEINVPNPDLIAGP